MNTDDIFNDQANRKLIPFLRDLADAIESKTLLPQQLQRIGEFFMSYKFQEQAIKDDKEPFREENTVSNDGNPAFERDEMVKFLCLGWYVYRVLLKNETLPDTNG
jgi:hypothetical protein